MQLRFIITEDGLFQFYLSENSGQGIFTGSAEAADPRMFIFVKAFENSARVDMNGRFRDQRRQKELFQILSYFLIKRQGKLYMVEKVLKNEKRICWLNRLRNLRNRLQEEKKLCVQKPYLMEKLL